MAQEKKLQDSILADLRSLGKKCECFTIQKTSDNGVMDIFFTTIKTGAVLLEVKRVYLLFIELQIEPLRKEVGFIGK